jgi:branched-chain amino acid aminotransferase
MLSRRKVWIDGKLIPFNKAQVPLMSHSFTRGSSVFEVMSLHNTDKGPAVFRLDDHIQRLFRSAEMIHMKIPLSAAKMKDAVKETLQANSVRQGMLKLICYYGGVEFEVVPRNTEVSVGVFVVDLQKDLSAERFKKSERRPAEVCFSDWRKIDPRTVPVECKCAANYLGGMVAKQDAIKKGFTAPVLLDLKGHIAEGATESLFLVKNGKLKTPKLDTILSGITRRSVLELAGDANLDVVEKKVRPQELLEADEAFFTSSVVKIWPISRVEDVKLEAPGEMTRLLERMFEKILTAKIKNYQKWFTIVEK